MNHFNSKYFMAEATLLRKRAISSIYLIVLLFLSDASFSQSCANYAVTRTTGITYTTIVGTGTSNFIWRNTASNQNDDNRSYSVTIGFDFWYLGVRYTTFSAALNGFIDFSTSTSDGNSGGTQPYGGNYNNWFSSANGTHLALAPMYDDPWTGGGGTAPIATSLVYKISGSAPNRVLTIEWINFDKWPSNSGSLNYQVKIYETTGIIEYVYGTMAAGTASFVYACGISNTWAAGASNAIRLLTQQTENTTTFNSTAKNNLSVLPASNSQLTYTPPTPTAAPTSLNFTALAKTGMTLNWTDNATNEAGYVIYNSTDGSNYNFVSQTAANAVSAAITGLYPSTTYYWKVYAVTDGYLSAALTGIQATLPAVRIISIVTGNWNASTTWDCSCIPTAGDSVIIADGTNVTLNINGVCYSLTVGQGVSGKLTIGNSAAARTLTVSKDVRVLTGATLVTDASIAATHAMSIGGNLTNNGTFDLAPTATNVCNITFNNNGNQTISGAGSTTNFNLITLNMGTSSANVLDVASTNFTIVPTNFLALSNGTFKLSTTAVVTPFSGAITIPASAGIWINNVGATTSTTGGTITLFGSLRVSAGTLNIGNASDNNLTSYGGTIIIDGGTVNIAGRLDGAGATILTYFTMSSGTLTVATIGSTTAGYAPFMIAETGSTFNMSGGTIIIERPGAGNLGYLNTGGIVGTVSGGTLQIGDGSTPAAQTIQINSNVSIYNLVISNGISVTAQLATNNLIVLNNFTINAAGIFNPAGLNFTVSGASTIRGTFADATIAGTSTLQDVDLSGGTINGGATGVLNMQNLTMPSGNATIGRIILTVNGTTLIPSGFGLTLNSNTGVKTFAGMVTLDTGGVWLSTTVSTTGNLIFQNGIRQNSGTNFTAGTATFNTRNQIIDGSGSLSFANVITVAGFTVTNNTTVSITANAAGQLTGAGIWTQGTNSTLNYTGTTITLTAGTGFDAQASGNTVNYNNTAANQTIFNPVSGIYFHLTLSNSTATARTKTLSATTDVNGDLTISGGNTIFSVSTFDINVAGNWTNTSTNAAPFTFGTRTVTFDGTTTQTIGGTTTTTFYNVNFNNDPATAGDITLATNNYIVNNQITMTQGNIDLNGQTLTLGTAVASPGTLSYSAGFFYGSTGTFKRWISSTSAAMGAIAANELGHFPMGTSNGDYRPLWLTYTANLTAGGTISVLHDPTASTTTASHNDASWSGGTIVLAVTNSNWVVSSANGFALNGATGSIRFGGQGFGTNTLTDLDASLLASTVGTFGATTNVNTTIEVNRTSLTIADLINTWRIGTKDPGASPLPITLIAFDAKPNSEQVDVTWATATETNNDYFTIERSKDGKTFENIGFVNGAGNSSSVLRYSFVDNDPYKGISYYRLKQTDFDGKYTYTTIVAVEFINSGDFNFMIYPNPTNGENINLSVEGNIGEEVLVVVYDITGKENYSKALTLQTEGNNIYTFNESEKLSPGIYMITATSNQNIYCKKLIVK